QHLNPTLKKALMHKEEKRVKARQEQSRRYPSNVKTRNDIFKYQSAHTKFVQTEGEKLRQPRVINVNNASFKELKVLPGMDAFLVKHMMTHRNNKMSFKSL